MGSSLRYIIVVLLIIFFGVLSTVFVVGRVRKAATPAHVPEKVHPADYVDKPSSKVTWTQQGRLVGDDLRRSVKITVTPTERRVDLLEGYDPKITKTAIFTNDKVSYTSFLLALENLNFGRERKVTQPDERGVCPLGKRYIYELHDGDVQKMRLWSDSCITAQGTYAGAAATTRQLFQAQITGYAKFISGVNF